MNENNQPNARQEHGELPTSELDPALDSPPDSPEPRAKRRRSRRRTWAYRLASMTLAPIFFIVFLEVSLRLYGFGYPTGFFLNFTDQNRELVVENLDFGRRSSPLEWSGLRCR